MTTLMSSTNKELPKIAYVKSIDVFLGTCFVMVFAALLEYATVSYLAKHIQMRKNRFAAMQKIATELLALQEQTRRQEEEEERLAEEALRAYHMPRGSRHSAHYYGGDDGGVQASRHKVGQTQQAPTTPKKIRIPINPNQICGITPSDIDK